MQISTEPGAGRDRARRVVIPEHVPPPASARVPWRRSQLIRVPACAHRSGHLMLGQPDEPVEMVTAVPEASRAHVNDQPLFTGRDGHPLRHGGRSDERSQRIVTDIGASQPDGARRVSKVLNEIGELPRMRSARWRVQRPPR